MNKTLSFLSIFMLAGCGGVHTNYAQQQINKAGEQEISAWILANEKANKTCQKGTIDKPLSRSKAMDRYNCRAAIIEKYVRPVVYSPIDLNQYLLDEKKASIAYKNGKIDRDEANLRVQEAFQAYVMRIDQKSREYLMTASQQDRALSQKLGQLSKQINATETQNQQALRANRPINTNCNRIGNSMNCTTW